MYSTYNEREIQGVPMNNEEKLNLKIVAVRQAFVKRVEALDEEVANLRVAITEQSQTLQELRQEYEDYKSRNPEEADVQEEGNASTEE
jgi:predicted HicB family RNase H-like nuclease